MTPAEELRYLILGAQREGNRLYAEALRPFGLTPAQAEVVTVLAAAASLSLRELGRRLVCESGSPSRLVDTLVRAGLVQRNPDAVDRRRSDITLTPAGEAAAISVRSADFGLATLLGAALSPDEIDAAVTTLRRLVDGRPAGLAITLRREINTDAISPGST